MTVEQQGAIVMPTIDVPYISQKDDETTARYGRKGCGLTALRMVLAHYSSYLSLDDINELIQKTGAYTEETGWIHAGMVNIARGVGLEGYRFHYGFNTSEDLVKGKQVLAKEGTSKAELKLVEDSFKFAKEHGPIADIKRLIDLDIPIIASMEKSYAKTLASHMIVLIGYSDNQFIVHDPWDFGAYHPVSEEEFLKHWTKRVVVITPAKK